MDKKITYHEQTSRENTLKLRSVLQTLPDFTKDFFRAIEPNTSAKTRISYVYDIRLFFQFLQINNPVFAKKDSIKDIRLEDLEQLQPVDIEEYLEYLKYYKDADGVIHTNKERGIHRKLAALRSFYAYYYKREYIHNNPTLIVDMPKLHKREIIRLDPDEVANLLDYVEHGGDEMTGMKKVYFERNSLFCSAQESVCPNVLDWTLRTLILTIIGLKSCVKVARKILYTLEMKLPKLYTITMQNE